MPRQFCCCFREIIILFSQFGRKKKKYRGTSTDTKNGEEVKQPVTVEEEEEEEEEEEGGDLSAYKLDSEEVKTKHELFLQEQSELCVDCLPWSVCQLINQTLKTIS